MLEIMIPRDIREYETKFLGPFTMRQSICFVIMLVILFANHSFQSKVLGLETTTYIPALVICVIPILFGWGKGLFGMEFEHYMRTVFINTYRKPKYRAFVTHNYHLIALEKMKKEEPETPDKKQKKAQAPRNVPYELKAFA